jgi:hypothetical protein
MTKEEDEEIASEPKEDQDKSTDFEDETEREGEQ